MSLNPVDRRIYMKGRLQLESPVIIGSGEDEHTNIDLIRDGNGNPFIPGTSLAGALRHHMEDILETVKNKSNPIVSTVFGKKEEESTQSLLTVFDAFPIDNSGYNVSARDGLELDYTTKTVTEHTTSDETRGGAKYDYEVIEPGAVFDLKLELITREKNQPVIDKIYDVIASILKALENGDIRLGAKTRRGFGKLRLEDIKVLELDMKNKKHVDKWINFNWEFEANTSQNELGKNVLQYKDQSSTNISAGFSIPYSMLIRHYNDDPSDEDTTQLMCDGKYIIPGTSWNGAVLHAIYHILNELVEDEEKFENTFKEIKHDLFGYVSSDTKEAKASRIFIEESIMKDSAPISYTRNKVDRFTGGVVDSALFSEKPVYGGSVVLNITVKDSNEWDTGLILLALKDMGNGIQSVGGDASIGRGVLEAESKDISINNEPLTLEKEKFYFKKLYDRLYSMKGETNG